MLEIISIYVFCQAFNEFNAWEGLFIDMQDNENNTITIANVYRPPKGKKNQVSIDMFLGHFTVAFCHGRDILETLKFSKTSLSKEKIKLKALAHVVKCFEHM